MRERGSDTKRRSSMVAESGALLLIALAVAALVLPACQRRQHARKDPLINVKALALTLLPYTQDYDGKFPGWVRNPDGRYAHGVWDEQINPYLKFFIDVYAETDRRNVGIRSCSDPQKQRVLTYGLNGLLMAPSRVFDGHAPFEAVGAGNPPSPMRVRDVTDPATTILFAELATQQPMTGIYGKAPDPLPRMHQASPQAPEGAVAPSERWQAAHDGWIDISPREFVETTGAGSYDRDTWDPSRGVARALHAYDGGGYYAFVDGQVKFMRLSETVGLGRTVAPPEGQPYTVEPGDSAWRADNPHNMWNPVRARTGLEPGD